MVTKNMKATFHCDLENVWNVVTSLENYSWRSDLSKIEVQKAGKKFIEYTKDGYATTFTITAFEPMKKYAFDMDNENMHGHWVGLFSAVNGDTMIDFTENITVKKWIMNLFVGSYLKKQQIAYAKDLKKALGL